MIIKKIVTFLVNMLLIILLVTACSSHQSGQPTSKKLRVAMQFGISYAPTYLCQNLGILEKYLPDTEIEWVTLGSANVINEALIADQLDIGSLGVPPALIAIDKGAPFKILSGVCSSPNVLMTTDPSIKTISDIKPNDHIAVPALGGYAHIMLAMEAKKVLGDAHFLDNNLIVMSHPDATTSILSGSKDVALHFASLPYLAKETDAGMTPVLTAEQAFGDECTFVAVVATTNIYEKNPDACVAFVSALEEAIQLINNRDPQAINIMAETEKTTADEIIRFLDWEGTNFTSILYGSNGLMQFMYEEKYISQFPESESDFLWPTVASAID